MVKKILLATRNKKKKAELLEILAGTDIEILTLEDLTTEVSETKEDGKNFQENAMKKALAAARQSNLITLADDSGLVVDALGGRPGVYSARYAGEHAGDEANNAKLLQEMAAIDENRRQAYFICVLALCSPQGGLIKMFEGRCYGTIAFTTRGELGFGYDPLFIPRGLKRTFGEMDAAEKHAISHRGQALGLLQDFLTGKEC